jgi:serine/threonine protein phosphatase PrpC
VSKLLPWQLKVYKRTQVDARHEAQTELMPDPQAESDGRRGPPSATRERPADSLRAHQRVDQVPRVFEELPEPPSIGRVASTWRRQLAAEDWPRASLVADCGEIGPMTLSAASAVGRTHAHRQRQRQDAYGFKLLPEVLLCAIADGVSSAPLGGAAADVAISTALTSAGTPGVGAPKNPLDKLELAVRVAGDAVHELAGRLLPGSPSALQQCATTLVLCAARIVNAEGDLEVSIAAVGDSSVMRLDPDGTVRTIIGPELNDRVEDLRDYLPKRDSKVLVAEGIIPAGSCLLLATDGFATDLRESQKVREWVAGQLWRSTTMLGAAHVLSYTRQRSSDDLTFLAVRPTMS